MSTLPVEDSPTVEWDSVVLPLLNPKAVCRAWKKERGPGVYPSAAEAVRCEPSHGLDRPASSTRGDVSTE